MIINLWGNVTSSGLIDFDTTPVYFDSPSFVAVTKVWIRLKSKQKEISTSIISSLVNKSSINPKQELIFFHHRENSRTFEYTPTHLISYKMQCQGLHFSVFEVDCFDENENRPKIEKVYLQLKITDARI